MHQRANPLECRPLRGCGRPASGPATAEVGAWNWAPRLHGASCWSAGCWRNRREVTDHRDGTPCDAQRLVLLLRVSPYVLFIERSSARCACRESREGGTVISRLPLQRLQARSRAVRNRGVGGTPASPHVDAHHVGRWSPSRDAKVARRGAVAVLARSARQTVAPAFSVAALAPHRGGRSARSAPRPTSRLPVFFATFASREGDHLMLPGVRRCTTMQRPHAVPQA